MPNTNINGVDIYYEVHGRGEPLVLIHHGLGSIKMWEKLLPAFAERYRVILYDRRGFGQSEKGYGFDKYYLSDQYSDNSVKELAALLEFLDIDEKINIAGQCEGGAIGFYYASQFPNKVKTVTASSTLCYSKFKMIELNKDAMYTSFEDAGLEFQREMIDWHGEAYARELYSLFLKIGGAYGSDVFDLREVLKGIECPVLVLYPDRSRLFDISQAVLMYKSLPGGELAVFPDCGHKIYKEQPGEYGKCVLSFLKRHKDYQ